MTQIQVRELMDREEIIGWGIEETQRRCRTAEKFIMIS
jgi:hypothetical protein